MVLHFACSSENDDSTPIEPELPQADFVVIGEDVNNVYQFSFDGSSETGEQFNLTQDLNITPGYLTLRETNDLLSFYYFGGGAFSLILKDVVTGASASYADFFANSPGRSVAWGINDETNVFFGFFGPAGTRNLGIQDVEFQGTFGLDTSVDEDIDFVYQPIFNDEKVYFAYRDNAGDYKFTFYDTLSQSIGPILNFHSIAISFLVTESGDIGIVLNGAQATFEIYDADSLGFLEAMPLNFGTAFNPGPIEGAVFKNNKLFYAFPFVQPATFLAGPAIFDLDTQENELIDFFGIAAEVEEEVGPGIILSNQIYDAVQDVFLVAYGLQNEPIRGGVMQISTEGVLIANVEVPFFPTYLLRN